MWARDGCLMQLNAKYAYKHMSTRGVQKDTEIFKYCTNQHRERAVATERT
jgi:hypothetical protein